MDELDLDSFIANIEETAPDESSKSKLICKECNVPLEEGEDGNYVCPYCSAQAADILQLDETELHHDEQGRPVFGQRVKTTERKSRHQVEYGWAWSTDDAVAHILGLQVEALERARLSGEFFRPAITNMWLKFWIENIAPHIKDSYVEDELVPISTRKLFKLRDIEVLVKVRDKVMIPKNLMTRNQNNRTAYKMYGSRFYASKPPAPEDIPVENLDYSDDNSTICSSSPDEVSPLQDLLQNEQTNQQTAATEQDRIRQDNLTLQDQNAQAPKSTAKTRNLSDESIAILTLNRTLAFIEATARCMEQNDPLFAADIIRACNQRVIPFYGASKLLPEGMSLNVLDRLMFQKVQPPTPVQLTRTASLLINKIYHDQLPKTLPTPNLSAILGRFIKDLNLPYELHDLIKDQYSFADFPATRPMVFIKNVKRRLPQYDRWAFALLLCQMKRLFNLTDKSITIQGERARMEARDKNEPYFDIDSWVQQLSLRLDLILRYDAYVLFHPMVDLDKLECTPQLRRYIELIVEERALASTRLHPNEPQFDPNFRADLNDLINRQLPLPKDIDKSILVDEQLDRSTNIKMPLTDAYERTQRFWANELEKDPEINQLVHRSHISTKLLISNSAPTWCIYDRISTLSRYKLEISPKWPFAYRLLLNAGAFLCFCDPIELMNEVRLVEECLNPQARINRRLNENKNKQ